jgi:hypothetical protein
MFFLEHEFISCTLKYQLPSLKVVSSRRRLEGLVTRSDCHYSATLKVAAVPY